MGSLEDLRDFYKTSRQLTDLKLKLNGSTYRKTRNQKTKVNTIVKNESLVVRKNDEPNKDIESLNNKYQLSESNVVYSLNKKKRWEFAGKLKANMPALADESKVDVRLYETRNRNEKKANLIAISKTKGDKVTVKSTYANLESIKKKEELDEMRRRNPELFQDEKLKKEKQNDKIERIIIDTDNRKGDDSEDDRDPYAHYQIEYAPTKDILKYGAKKYNTRNLVGGKGAATGKKYAYDDYYDEEEYYASDIEAAAYNYYSDEDDDYEQEKRRDTTTLSLELMLDQYLNSILDREEEKSIKEATKQSLAAAPASNASSKGEQKLYYVNQQRNDAVVVKPSFNRAVSIYAKKVPIVLTLNKASVNPEALKQAYGLKYSEAHACYPRNFNINMSEDVVNALVSKGLIAREQASQLDVKVWLTFQEIPSFDDEFRVSFCTNLKCESLGLENVNVCEEWTVEQVHAKAVEFLSVLPLELFRRVPETNVGKLIINRATEFLTTISGNNVVKSIEDLKLELVGNKEVTKQKDVDEKKDKASFESILKDKKFECVICLLPFDSLHDCVLMRECGHATCNACMQDYVDSRLANALSNAGKSLPCPACDAELELALMINYASNGGKLDTFIRVSAEKIARIMNTYKWCTTPGCTKMLEASAIDLSSTPYGIVTCTCGLRMCLKCSEPAHFPASCSQTANYYKELKSQARKASPPSEDHQLNCLLAKRCPVCKYVVEKNGGCNQMVCQMCHEPFCWDCLQKWSDHLKSTQGTHGCVKSAKSDSQVIIEIKSKRKEPKESKKRFQEAQFHREKRSPTARKEYEDKAKRLFNTINNEEIVAYLLNSDDSNELQALLESDKATSDIVERGKILNEKRESVRKFLIVDMIKFISELHFICEHALLSKRDESLPKEKREIIAYVSNNLETLLWRIGFVLERGTGMNAIVDLEQIHEKAINMIKLLKSVNI